jgi:hypothetical protein
LAGAVALYQGNFADGNLPVVPITQVNGDATRALLAVTHLTLDSTPDIQRRRRDNVPLTKTTTPLT